MGRHKKAKNSPLIIYLFVSMLILSVVTIGLIKFIDILPNNYFGILVTVFVIIDFAFTALLFSTKKFIKFVGALFTTFYMFVLIVAILYEINTIDFLKKIGKSDYTTQNYSLLVLKSSEANELKDLKDKKIGIVSDYKEEALSKITKKVNVEFEEQDYYGDLVDRLESKKYDAILLEDSFLSILNDENPSFISNSKVLYKFSIDLKEEQIKGTHNITKNPYNIYISGIDTYGKINSVSRSDVNMLITVNPITNKILITTIPRDYYVYLPDKKENDKLTHAGIYGVKSSIDTIENLLGVKIDYYVKVNFTSLVKIVDTLDGIDVDSKYAFTSQDNYTFKKGTNHLNGKEALSFVRERKALPDGDRSRGENHQAVLTSVINKMLNISTLTKYNDLLRSLKPSMVTNFTNNQITDFVKMQLKKNPNWEFEYILLDGADGYEYTYSYSKNKLYVMIPDEDSINSASIRINEIQSQKQ